MVPTENLIAKHEINGGRYRLRRPDHGFALGPAGGWVGRRERLREARIQRPAVTAVPAVKVCKECTD